AEARLREGRAEAVVPPPPSDAPAPALPTSKVDRTRLIRMAQDDWLRAADLSQRVGNPTYRSEAMYRVADSMAFGSQTIVNEFPGPENGSGGAPPAGRSNGLNTSFDGLPDLLLQQAAALSARIDRPVWHDRGLVAVATAAAESRQ